MYTVYPSSPLMTFGKIIKQKVSVVKAKSNKKFAKSDFCMFAQNFMFYFGGFCDTNC